jgi:hypothetical protein
MHAPATTLFFAIVRITSTIAGFAPAYPFKIGANSGIIFQVAEDPKYKYPYETGPDYQVIDQRLMNYPAASSGVSKYKSHKTRFAASCGELTPK